MDLWVLIIIMLTIMMMIIMIIVILLMVIIMIIIMIQISFIILSQHRRALDFCTVGYTCGSPATSVVHMHIHTYTSTRQYNTIQYYNIL